MRHIANDIAARVGVKLAHECWTWPGAKTPTGYGKIGRDGQTLYVHRVMYQEHVGAIPEGAVVMHACDNPSCCNPRHLTLGTHADNSADMVRKKRSRAGEAHTLAKLSAAQVQAIREACKAGHNHRHLARDYGVSFQQISRIARGKSWAVA